LIQFKFAANGFPYVKAAFGLQFGG
jgi:hypothetical protein